MASKTAVVIKGGLAKGFGAIGFIRFLEENDIYPDVLVGASSGAQIAAMYAIGKSWKDMENSVSNYRMRQTSSVSSLLLHGHLFPQDLIKNFFLELNQGREITFDQTARKVMFIATNRKKKEQEILFEGKLVDALLASNAFPGIIRAQKFRRKLYVDGDLPGRFMVDSLKQMGYRNVIGVQGRDEIQGKIDQIVSKIAHSLVDDKWVTDADKLDLLLDYDVSDIGFVDFAKIPKVASRIYRKSKARKEEILSLF